MPAKSYINELTCPVCGKIFICQYKSAWAYKQQFNNRKMVFCSWGCISKYRKQVGCKPTKRGRRKKQ